MTQPQICTTKNDLEKYSVDFLYNITLDLEEIFRAKPFLYAKKW